jgi:hypothetical protein
MSSYLAPAGNAGTDRAAPRWKLALGIAVVLIAISVPLAVGSHQFADVPTGHIFHTNITNLANSGVTAGCGGSNYCPDAPVTRGSMAAFLNRGLGRATTRQQQLVIDGSGTYNMAELTIETGGTPGGTGFVFLTGTASIRVGGDGYCPCTIGMSPEPTNSLYMYTSLPDIDSPPFANWKQASVSNNAVVAVESGESHTFRIAISLNTTSASTDDIVLSAQLSAFYVPFGAKGTNSLTGE